MFKKKIKTDAPSSAENPMPDPMNPASPEVSSEDGSVPIGEAGEPNPESSGNGNSEKGAKKGTKKNFLVRIGRGLWNFIKSSPKVCIGFWIAAGVAGILHILSGISPAFADFIMRYPNSIWRWIAAKITMWIPFSLAELLIISIPVILVSLISLGIYVSVKGTSKQYIRLMAILLSVISYFYAAFVLTLAPGYKGTTLDQKMGLVRNTVSGEELYETGVWLNGEITPLLDQIAFLPDSASYMPYTLDEMNDKLNDAYAILADEVDFVSSLRSNIKYVVLSEPMSYTHITGVYTFFTGESNLNVNFPDYTLPYTAAHEFAHQRGIAREDEANFVAFLASMESDDPYILYSAYVNMLEYVMNALYTANKDLYMDLYRQFDSRLVGEFNAYAQFYEKYRENKVADVSSAVNNSYLQSQGVEVGSRSYGLVVDLTVAYYHAYVENVG
ncbi:MAG: DUF3810 domain-containing protein [Eubacteriales bacterium]